MLEQVVPYAGWAYLRNIGDKIGANVIEYITGAKPVLSDRKVNHVLTIGSILFLCNRNSYIWGSGCLSSSLPHVEIDASRICALRGKRTADLLTRSGYKVPDVPFGDPGIFIGDVIKKSGVGPKKRKSVAIVPHYSSYPHYRRSLSLPADVDLIDVATDGLDPIERIMAADVVLSESLHGLIFGIAFGKEVTWIGNENHDNFKYHDWFSTTDNPDARPFKLKDGVDKLVKMAEKITSTIDKNDLYHSFPQHLIYNRDATGMVDYKSARSHEFYFSILTRNDLHISHTPTISPSLLFLQAKEYMSTIFRFWDEPTYAIISIAGEGPVPNRNQIQELLFELDHHVHPYGVVIKKSEAEAKGLKPIRCGEELWYCLEKIDTCGTVIIRPDYENRVNDFMVFCV